MIDLKMDAFGRLVYVAEDGRIHADVVPVRAFPLSSPKRGISLMSREGREIAWIASAEELHDAAVLEEALREREFLPEILRIESIEGAAVPNLWKIVTDRGSTAFTLKSEDDIRRIGRASVILTAKSGVLFLIRDLSGLDRHSRRLLAKFL